jgi:hypothetical protein
MGVFGTDTRVVTLAITGAALTYEALEVAVAKVREMEQLYAVNPSAVTNLTGATLVLTGKTPYKVFIFEVTTVKATGAYTFECTEIAPNVETATTL